MRDFLENARTLREKIGRVNIFGGLKNFWGGTFLGAAKSERRACAMGKRGPPLVYTIFLYFFLIKATTVKQTSINYSSLKTTWWLLQSSSYLVFFINQFIKIRSVPGNYNHNLLVFHSQYIKSIFTIHFLPSFLPSCHWVNWVHSAQPGVSRATAHPTISAAHHCSVGGAQPTKHRWGI